MAITLSYTTPLTDLNFANDLENGPSGGFSTLFRSDAGTVVGALNEVIAYCDTNGLVVGNKGGFAPYDKTIIINRTFAPISDSDGYTYIGRFTCGPFRNPNKSAQGGDFVFKFSSALSSAETNVDINGNLIEVGTLDTAEPTPTGGPYTAVPKTSAQVIKQFPTVRVTASATLANNPFTSYNDKIGTLNEGSLTLGEVTFGDGRCMLVGADVQTPTKGDNYITNFEFEVRQNERDWEAVVVAIDPKTGKPYQNIKATVFSNLEEFPSGTTGGVVNGSRGFAMYEKTDLQSLLRLT